MFGIGNTLYSTFTTVKFITKASWLMADLFYYKNYYYSAANIAFNIWCVYC